jgi:hypothetical protein
MANVLSAATARPAQAAFLQGDFTARFWSGAAGFPVRASLAGLSYDDDDPHTTIYTLKRCEPESYDSMCQQSIQRC